jgi:plastocyanin
MRILLLSLLFLLAGLSASAHDLNVRVTDASGAPVANAVVLVAAPSGTVVPASFAWPNMMEQKDIQFAPHILVAPLGSKVQFPNRDRVRHHVYSFSKGNRFELKLYGQEESRFMEFKTPGIVAVGCNIHDNMIGYIRIVDTPFANRTDADGKATLTGLPSATGSVTVWHPDLADGKDVVSAFNTAGPETVVALGGAASVAHAHH